MASISGPVGLRHRKQNVTNKAVDQATIIGLLAVIPESQGGKGTAWATPPIAGGDGSCPPALANAIWEFQDFWKKKGVFHNIDGVVDPGMNTLKKLNELSGGGPPPPSPTPPADSFVCGPDVTEQIAAIWGKIQSDFRSLSRSQKISACNTILIPIQPTARGLQIPTNLEELKKLVQRQADIDGWDTLPLFQGASQWLRRPPVYNDAIKGPCATPSSSDFSNPNPFAPGHEDNATCSNTVQVAGQCWLNGTVNYGTFGVMVRLCKDFAASDPLLRFDGITQTVYTLEWAKMLIKAYKRFGQNPEGATLPIAWTEATFTRGPRGVPTVAGNRPKCKCTCGCKGDVTSWDYIWKPFRPGGRPTR